MEACNMALEGSNLSYNFAIWSFSIKAYITEYEPTKLWDS